MENKSSTCHMTSEQRLIDANALQFEPDWWGGMNGVICVGRSGGKTMATVQAALKRMIDNAPTVDAVEVVRCKVCTHCKLCYPEKQIGKEPTPGWYCKEHGRYRRPDDFCSYGERREGE